MVIAADFIDPFNDDIVAFPVNSKEKNEWRTNIIELIIGAIVFLAVVAIYNALFSIWERIFKQKAQTSGYPQDLSEQDDVFVRVTYAIFVSFLAYLIISYLGPSSGRLSRQLPGRHRS